MAGRQIAFETAARRPLDERLEQLHEADLDMIGGRQHGSSFDNGFDNGFDDQALRRESISKD